jgi:hypothetical protein
MKQKILFLQKFTPAYSRAVAEQIAKDAVAWLQKTAGQDITIEASFADAKGALHSKTTPSMTGYDYASIGAVVVEESEIANEAHAVEIERKEQFDIVFLLHDFGGISGSRPTFPVHTSILIEGMTVCQMGLSPVPPAMPTVMSEYVIHELLHAWYYLAKLNGAPVEDDVHKFSGIYDPRPDATYVVIVNKLRPYFGQIHGVQASTVPEQPKSPAPGQIAAFPDAVAQAEGMKWVGSPNFAEGRAGWWPEAIVLHIMEGSLASTDAWFKNKASQASAHYGIGKKGEGHQYVKEEDQAWHAGIVKDPTWKLLHAGVNPNKYTIAIEHEGYHGDVWSAEQITSSGKLVADICKRWNIPIDRDHIIGHYQIGGARRANCPATDKSIIEKVIAAAKSVGATTPPVVPQAPAAIAVESVDAKAEGDRITVTIKIKK